MIWIYVGFMKLCWNSVENAATLKCSYINVTEKSHKSYITSCCVYVFSRCSMTCCRSTGGQHLQHGLYAFFVCFQSLMLHCIALLTVCNLHWSDWYIIDMSLNQVFCSTDIMKNKITFKRTRSLSNAARFKYVKYLTTNTIILVLLCTSILCIKHTYYIHCGTSKNWQ